MHTRSEATSRLGFVGESEKVRSGNDPVAKGFYNEDRIKRTKRVFAACSRMRSYQRVFSMFHLDRHYPRRPDNTWVQSGGVATGEAAISAGFVDV
jgi:hypothetical protein